MNNPRLFLWLALAALLFLNYETWMRDYAVREQAAPAAAASNAATNGTGSLDSAVPQAPKIAPAAAAPDDIAASAAAVPGVPDAAGPPDAAATDPQSGRVHVVTDVLDLAIGLRGGELTQADLLAYPKVKNQPAPMRLFRREGRDSLYVLQTGLAGSADAATRPTHQELLKSAASEYRLLPGQEELRVPLTWTDDAGVTVTKTFVFRRGMYSVALEYQIENRSAAPWAAVSYAQILHDTPPIERSYFKIETTAFEGPAIYDGIKYQRLKIDDKEDASLARDIKGGWFAALQHHFVSAIIPPFDQSYRYTLKARGNEYLATTVGPTQEVAPGASGVIKETLFVGPKLQAQLDDLHPELSRVADYGALTFLSKPLFWLLQQVHDLFRNWGVAIIVVTALLKLLFYPLAEISGRSMAKMKILSPRIKSLQETYKDDREKLGRAMMDLYKRERINPAAGCLPIIIQIPVFLAFYWVLLESVEMRQAPFAGWIQDLSARDPIFVLPAIMAAAMFVQYKLQPMPSTDPIQQKVFMFLPLIMSATFALFPSGLVLYWVTNTVLTILQQWNVNRRIEAKSKARG